MTQTLLREGGEVSGGDVERHRACRSKDGASVGDTLDTGGFGCVVEVPGVPRRVDQAKLFGGASHAWRGALALVVGELGPHLGEAGDVA